MIKKAWLAALTCVCFLSACTPELSGQQVQEPGVDEGRITMATVAGREHPFFTFSSRVMETKAKITAARLAVSTTGDLHSGGKLIEAETLEAQYDAKRHQLLFITDGEKNKDLEATLNKDGAEVAFRWEIDFKAPDNEATHTSKSVIYKTNRKDIAAANLAHEIK